MDFASTKTAFIQNPVKIAPIKEAPRPTNVKQVQSFLGAVNYLAEFVSGPADKAEPLRMLTGKGEPFCWGGLQEKSFRDLKDTISSDLELAIFDPQAPTIVTVDASDVGLGAQLTQIYNGREVPVQFASHTLVDREQNFATNEKEALSCIWAIEHWEKFLLGHHFTLRTDHRALRSLLHQHSSTRKSAKFERWLERLSQFDYTVEHVRGTHNYIADALSRLPRPASEQPPPPAIIDDEPPELQATIASLAHGSISLDAIQRHTDADTLLHQVKEYIRHCLAAQSLSTNQLIAVLQCAQRTVN